MLKGKEFQRVGVTSSAFFSIFVRGTTLKRKIRNIVILYQKKNCTSVGAVWLKSMTFQTIYTHVWCLCMPSVVKRWATFLIRKVLQVHHYHGPKSFFPQHHVIHITPVLHQLHWLLVLYHVPTVSVSSSSSLFTF